MYNTDMNINSIMNEYGIEPNDVRWYLANNNAFTLLEYHNDVEGLVKYIECGQLEVDLYNMEERYIEELQDLADRNKLDEVDVREIFNKIIMLKSKR